MTKLAMVAALSLITQRKRERQNRGGEKGLLLRLLDAAAAAAFVVSQK